MYSNCKFYILPIKYLQYKSSHKRCSVKKGVLRNFAKFTGKHLCQSLFFNKVLRTPFSQNKSGRLFLNILYSRKYIFSQVELVHSSVKCISFMHRGCLKDYALLRVILLLQEWVFSLLKSVYVVQKWFPWTLINNLLDK